MNRDIKSENCLYDSDMKAYIADWGIGVYWPYMGAKLEYNVATPSYRPPEVYQNAKYDMSFDIFSLGLVGLDLHLRKAHNSLEGENPQGLEVKNVKDEKNYKLMIRNLYGINVTADLPKLKAPIKALINAPEPLKQLLQWMICNDPKVRPTISQVLHHPYFDSERGTRTFPEISYIEMLRNSPPMNMVTEVDNKSSTDPMEKLQLISNSNYVISVFLALAFYNRYKAKNGVLKGVDLTDTCLYLARSLIEGGTWEKDKTIKNSVKVAKLLNYELMGCIPYLFFRNPTKRVIRELLMYELAATQPYHPYTVASIIAHTDAKDGSIFLKSSYPIINHPSVSDFYGHLNQTYRALSSDKKDEFNEIVDDLYTLISNDEYFLFLLQSPDKARAFRDSL